MASKSIAKNYIYDLLYRIIYIISPLVTAPYISRVIGAEGIGDYSYTQSICSYFALIAILGTNIYGQREIAFCREDRRKRSNIFWEIFYIRLIGILTSSMIYFLVCLHASGTKRALFLIQSVDIIGLISDITWLLQGVEEFCVLLYRNIIVKVLSIISIFIFIKTQKDLYTYVLLTSLAVILGNLSVWSRIHKYIDLVDIKKLEIKKHLLPAFSLFLPTIALRLYDAFDKTMLGVLAGSSVESGFYEQTLKIITMAITVVTSLGNVMSPRMAALYSQDDKEKLNAYLYSSFEVVWTLALPITVGIIAISDNLIPWFLGEGYDQVIILLKSSSLLCIAMGIKNVIGLQYLVPTKRQDKYTRSILVGLMINIALNGVLIPLYRAVGAVIASVISEYFVVLIQLYMVKEEIDIRKIIGMIQWKSIASLVMGGIVYLLSLRSSSSISNTIILMMIGCLIYFGFLYIVKDPSISKLKGSVISKRFRKRHERSNNG